MHSSDAGWKFRSVSGEKDSVHKQKRRRAQQFALESLESRCLLSTIAEYPIPKISSASLAQPAEITSAGEDLWFAESGGAIGMVDPANPGTIVSYSQGLSSSASPQGITVGSDGNIWFTELTAGAIGMLRTSNPAANIQNYTTGMLAHALPFGITSVPAGDVWFTDPNNNAIGWINPSSPNSITEIQVPSSLVGIESFSSLITAGPRGKLYFTEAVVTVGSGGTIKITSSAIGIYDPSAPPANQWSQVSLPSGQEPFGIAVGPDNQSIWYTWEIPTSVGSGLQSSGIGTFNALAPPSTIPPGSSFQLTTPSGGVTPQPNQITSGPDGELYLTDTGNGAIYSIDPTSDVISQPNFVGKPVISNPLPSGITTGPDGNLWFTDDGQQAATPTASGAVGVVDRLAIATQPPASVPASVTAGAAFGFTVYVETAGDTIDSSYNGNVTVAIANNPNPGGSTLGGTPTVAAVKGVATFSGLTLTTAATGYTLAVSGSGLSGATSSAITVTPAAATQLMITQQPPATVTAGSGFPVAVAVAFKDKFGNAATFSGDVNVALSTSPSNILKTVLVNGGSSAQFSGLTWNNAGNYSLLFTASGLTSITSNSFTVVPVSVAPPAPQIQSATVLTYQKKNRRGKPIGKPVLTGYQFTFNMAMNPSITNLNDYQVQIYVPAKGRGKNSKPAHYQAIGGFSLINTSSTTVQVLIGTQTSTTFKNGGRITLIGTGISSKAGALLGNNVLCSISKGGKSITLG